MRYDLLRDWLAVMIVILAVAVALGLWLSRRIAQPLTTLAAHVRQLHPSRATPPLHIEHADREVELVSRALEELNERVHAFVQREQLFTRGASHELRTPLSVMRSATAQVLDDDTLQPPSRRLLTLAMHSAVRMERTVAILLTLTREDAVPHPEEPVRIRPVVEAVVLDAAAALDASGLTVHVEVADAATLPVAADVLHLLLSSLIGNAITHASRGPISVRAVADGISVSNPVDTTSVPSIATLGIPGVKSAASPGTGLGLALLHRLCTRAGLTVVWQVERGVFDVVVSTG